jgi:hypothetical protein
MARLTVLFFILLSFPGTASALAHWEGFCEQGGQKVATNSAQSTTNVQQSYPGATLTVYLTGTGSPGTKATLYSTNTGTALANPLTCSTFNGYYSFYAANGSVVDLTFSGAGIAAPFTIGAVPGIEPVNQVVYPSAGNTFHQQCVLAASLGQTLQTSAPGAIVIAASENDSGCAINFLSGYLQPASGQTVTLSQDTYCQPTQQCYDISAGGTIAFVRPPASVTPINFGADPTGTVGTATATTAAFNAAAASIITTGGDPSQVAGVLTVPAGSYYTNGSIAVNSTYGAEVNCLTGSKFYWASTTVSNVPFFKFTGTSNASIHGCTFIVTNATYPMSSAGAAAMEFTTGAVTSTGFHVYNNTLSAANNLIYDFILVDGNGATNNDFGVFEKNFATGYNYACFDLQGGESYSHRLTANQCLGYYGGSTGQYGVAASGGTTPGFAASFVWQSGGMQNSTSDFYMNGLSAFTDEIYDVDTETQGSFLISNAGNWQVIGGRIVCCNTTTLAISNAGGNAKVQGVVIFPYRSDELITMVHTPGYVGPAPPGIFEFENVNIQSPNASMSDKLFPGSATNSFLSFNNLTWADNTAGIGGSSILTTTNGGQGIKYSTGTATGTSGTNTLTISGGTLTAAMAGTSAPGTDSSVFVGGHAYRIQSINTGTGVITLLANLVTSPSSAAYVLAYNGGTLEVPSFSGGATTIGNTIVNGTLTVSGVLSAPEGNVSNYIGPINLIPANGTNNALTTAAGVGPPLSAGLTLNLSMNFSLRANASNTLAYQGGSALPIYSVYQANLGTGIPSGQILTVTYNSGGFWQTQTP